LPTPEPTPPLAVSVAAPSGKVDAMQVFAEGAACKGKVGKAGAEYLVEKDATAESCQEACLRDKTCKYATLFTKGNSKKWNCVKFKKCKISKKQKKKKSQPAVSYKKAKVKASQMGDPKYFFLES
jgi:hypothetical protein